MSVSAEVQNDPPADESVEDNLHADQVNAVSDEPKGLELTPRQLALARGEDPNETSETEENAGTEEVAGGLEPQPADGGKEAAPQSAWIDSEVKSFAGTYGLTDEELAEFDSRADFDRFTRMFDKKVSRSAETPVTTDTMVESKAEAKTEAKSKVSLDVEEYRKNGYDDETIKLVEHSKMLEDEVAAMRAQQEQLLQQHYAREQMQTAQQFHELADKLDPKRFGKIESTNFSKQNDEARRKLWEEADTIVHGIRERARVMGVEPVIPPLQDIIKRAYRMGFAEDVEKEATKTAKEQLLKQSKTRRPVQSQANNAPRQTSIRPDASQLEQAKHIASNPKIAAMYDKMQEENGFN